MATVRELITRWGFDIDRGGVDALEKLDKRIGTMKNAAKAAGVALIGMAAGVSALVVKLSNTGDKIAKMSRALGISTDAYQQLGYAADMAGASQDDVNTGLRTLARQMDSAAGGTKEAVESFAALGVEFQNTDGSLRPLQDVFLDMADGMARMDDPARRVATAQALLGRGGLKLINVLEQGGDAFRASMQEAKNLGLVLGEDVLEQSEILNDQFTRLKRTLDIAGTYIAAELQPIVSELIQKLLDWWRANKNIVSGKLKEWVRSAVGAVKGLAEWLGAVLVPLSRFLESMGGGEGAIGGFKNAVQGLFAYQLAMFFFEAAAAVAALGKAFTVANLLAAINPVVALAMAIGAVVAFREPLRELMVDGFGYLAEGVGWLVDKVITGVELMVNAWQNFAESLSEIGALLGLMDAVKYEEFKIERPKIGAEMGAPSRRLSAAEAAAFTGSEFGRQAAGTTTEAAKPIGPKVTMSAAEAQELLSILGTSARPSPPAGGMGTGGGLAPASIAVTSNLTVNLPAGTTVSEADALRRILTPVVEEVLGKTLRNVQEDLATS